MKTTTLLLFAAVALAYNLANPDSVREISGKEGNTPFSIFTSVSVHFPSLI